MARPPNSDSRQAAILAATEKVIGEKGFAKATIAEIAREAGLAPGLLHYHFSCKQEILLRLVSSLDRRVSARIEAVLSHHPTPWQRVEAYVQAHLGKGDGESATAVRCWATLASESASVSEVGDVYRGAIGRRTQVLKDLLSAVAEAEGRERRFLLPLAAMGQAAIEGAFCLSGAAPGVIPPGSAAGTLISMLRGAMDRVPVREAKARSRRAERTRP